MIELSDEMKAAFEAAAYPACWVGGDPLWELGLAAVLAIVERDYEVDPKLPPVEHGVRREPWFNHYAQHFEAECVCGESFADGLRDQAVDRLMDHLQSEARP